MVLLPNGQVLASGGRFAPTTSDLYNPATLTWTPTGAFTYPHDYFEMVLLPTTGQVLAAGSFTSAILPAGVDTRNTAELYTPGTGTWAPTAGMSQDRWQFQMVVVANQFALAAGGNTNIAAPVPSATVEVYLPAGPSWFTLPSMLRTRSIFQMLVLQDGRVLAAGGAGNGPNTAEIFDGTTWTLTGTTMQQPRENFQMVLLPNGQALAAGGDQSPVTAELYDPVLNQWTATGSLVTPRQNFQMTLLPSGLVLASGTSTTFLSGNAAELYNPATQLWSSTTSMTQLRYEFRQLVLPSA